MEQTIEESVEAEEISEQEDSSELDSDGEDRPIIKRECNSKSLDNDKYEQNPNYKKIESKNTPKKSEKKDGLEKIANESSNVSFTINKGGKIVPIYEGREVYDEGASMPRWFIGVNADSLNSNKGEDTPNGVLAFLYYYNEETGKLEFLFEQVRLDYSSAKERGKIKLFGGYLKTTDTSSIDGFIREVGEEFEPLAAYVITKALRDNGRQYDRIYYNENGQYGYTDILDIEIKSKTEWEIAKNAMTKHDAGMPRVFTETAAHKLNDEYYALGYAYLIKGFIVEKSRNPKFQIQDIYFKSSPNSDSTLSGYNSLENRVLQKSALLN